MVTDRRLLRVVLGTFLAASAVAWPVTAVGHERTTLDADDSAGPLDIVAVRTRHKAQTEVTTHPERSRREKELRFRLVTYEKWSRSLLEGANNFVAIEFNLDDDKRIERCVRVRNGENELVGRLYRGCYRRMKLVTSVSVSRPDKHTLLTAFGKDRLRRRLGAFRWRATTSFEDPDGEEGDPCWPGTSPNEGPYGVCRDGTRWSSHRFR